MQLVSVIAGAVIGLIGVLGGSWVTHRLGAREDRRSEKLQAYAEWSAAVLDAAEAWRQLRFFDAMEEMKKSDRRKEIQSVPSSVTGMPRGELAATWLNNRGRLRVAQNKVMLLERDADICRQVTQISGVAKSTDSAAEAIRVYEQTEKEVTQFLRHLNSEYFH